MSVAMVSASFHPHVGGAEKQALELAAQLRGRGVAVLVATRRLPGLAAFEEVRSVPVYRLWRAGKGPLDAATFMLSLAWVLWKRRKEYRVIHVHLGGSPALAAAVMGRLLRKRVVVKLGGGAGIGELAVSARSMMGTWKLLLLARLKPTFVAVTGDVAEEARRYLGMEAEVVPNGVDAEAYKPASNEERAALRERHGWPARALVFIYVGRFSPEKRLPQFVETWAQAAHATARECLFVLVGAGPEREKIEAAAAAARVSAKVRFVAPTTEVAALYAAADVFVLPSISEGLSNALLEAMACGLASLASRVGGTPEAVQDGVSGLLFAPLDEAALSSQLRRLFETPGLTVSLGAAARRTAAEHFSLKATAQRYESLYGA